MGRGAHALAYSSPPAMPNKAALSGGKKEGRRKKNCFARISPQKIKQCTGSVANESIITHLIMQKHSQVIMCHANSQHEAKGLLSTAVEEEWHQY